MSKAFVQKRFKEASESSRNQSKMSDEEEESWFGQLIMSVVNFVNRREYFYYFLLLALLCDLILSVLIVKYVKYTEIDWIAYMQEVAGFLGGDMNYANLRGDTGPLVYPAGFVYIYSVLYYITNYGENILLAQYIFVFLYLLLTALAAIVLFKTNRVPTMAILMIFVSKRIHSIFMLRCFNDGIAMILLYMAILCFIYDKWTVGCCLYSLAVSVKMNILLFAPGLLLLLWQRFGFVRTLPKLFICALIQLVLGLPFLLTYPYSYIKGSFDLGRVFTYIWTVNFKFIDEEVFVSKNLASSLLIVQLVLLVVYFNKRESSNGGLVGVFKKSLSSSSSSNLPPHWIVSGLFLSNFIGILCARSLHFQFYVWYFHSLPLLLWLTPLPVAVRVMIMIVLERVWNTFPSTAASSIMLQCCHVLIIVGLWMNLYTHNNTNHENKQVKRK